MFCQELERQLMNQLNRPECLKDTFVNPDVQCPPKQRGRKKKATPASSTKEHMGRPSAAACGFSTQGMTDQEVHEKLAKQRKATEDDEESPPTTAKRTRKSKATAKSMASGRPKKAKRTRKSKDYDHESNENPPAKAKRTRKSKASGDDEKKEIPPTNPEPKALLLAMIPSTKLGSHVQPVPQAMSLKQRSMPQQQVQPTPRQRSSRKATAQQVRLMMWMMIGCQLWQRHQQQVMQEQRQRHDTVGKVLPTTGQSKLQRTVDAQMQKRKLLERLFLELHVGKSYEYRYLGGAIAFFTGQPYLNSKVRSVQGFISQEGCFGGHVWRYVCPSKCMFIWTHRKMPNECIFSGVYMVTCMIPYPHQWPQLHPQEWFSCCFGCIFCFPLGLP